MMKRSMPDVTTPSGIRRHSNALVRELLMKTVLADRKAAISEMFRLMDANPGNSQGRRWTREDLYAR